MDGLWPDCLHLLGNHADIDPIAPIVLEAVQAEAARQGADLDDVVLEQEVGTASAAATPATATTPITMTALRRPSGDFKLRKDKADSRVIRRRDYDRGRPACQ